MTEDNVVNNSAITNPAAAISSTSQIKSALRTLRKPDG